MKYIKKCIKILLIKSIWLTYYFFYLLPIDCYFYIKSFLGLLKENEYLGNSDFGDKICIFVSYPKDGRISESLNRYLLDLQLLGYSIIFITNKHVVLEDIEKIKSICVRIIIRENYGKDFGAYKHGILKYKNQILNSKNLLIANDSVIHIKSLKPMFDVMNAKNLDFWGISEAYGPATYENYHLGSYFLVIDQKILKSEIFWNFWRKYKPTYSRVQVINN
jgi:lipopolysaccharide biosynthesis protein